MSKFLGIKFAPLFIPIERRIQTLVTLCFTHAGLLAMCGLFFGIFLIFTPFYFIPLGYSIWYFYDRHTPHRGGRTVKWVREMKSWDFFRDYFPVSLVKKSDLSADKNYIFVCHPHGIMPFGMTCNFGSEATGFSKLFPGLKPHMLTLEVNFKFPLYREFLMATGASTATYEGMEWLLTKEGKGQALVLIVGGALEALDAVPGKMELTLNRRKGFVKLALKHG